MKNKSNITKFLVIIYITQHINDVNKLPLNGKTYSFLYTQYNKSNEVNLL